MGATKSMQIQTTQHHFQAKQLKARTSQVHLPSKHSRSAEAIQEMIQEAICLTATRNHCLNHENHQKFPRSQNHVSEERKHLVGVEATTPLIQAEMVAMAEVEMAEVIQTHIKELT